MKLIQAETPEHIKQIRKLFREYEASIGINLCFQGFVDELANLPGQYAPPRGSLLLAIEKNTLAGCAAMRGMTRNACEMKRLYVRKEYRGMGIGGKLAEKIIKHSRQAGYTEMYLDTLSEMKSAIALYRSLGFRETKPYYHNPIEGAVYFKLHLTP